MTTPATVPPTDRQRILAELERGDGTYEELFSRLGYAEIHRMTSVRARLHDMDKQGYVEKVGKRAANSGVMIPVYRRTKKKLEPVVRMRKAEPEWTDDKIEKAVGGKIATQRDLNGLDFDVLAKLAARISNVDFSDLRSTGARQAAAKRVISAWTKALRRLAK